MAKRKKFGSPPKSHRLRAAIDLREVRHYAKMLRTNLNRGECRRAFIRLKLAIESDAEYRTERKHGAKGRSNYLTTRQIGALSDRFRDLCIVK